MLTLAIETVTAAGSIATCVDGRVPEGRVGNASRTHAERLPVEIIEWLAAHGQRLADVDVLSVVTGPGSFTGLRVGIAAIQGLALASDRRVVGVPTLDAMVSGWLSTMSSPGAVVIPCLDGQRGEVFAAALDTSDATTADDCVRLLEPLAARPEEIVTLLTTHLNGRHAVIVGDGARRYRDVFLRHWPDAEVVDLPVPLAEAAVRIASARPDRAVAPHALQPIYLRRPDAFLARERAEAAKGSTPASYVVRRAGGPDDLAAVDALQRQTFTNPWGAEAIRWELEHTDVSRLYVMHDAHGALVAYCACWMVFDELHINSLAVDTGRRRTGVARQLLEHVLREAAEAGATSATLEVRSSNAAARALYDGLGFKVEGLRRDYYQDPREDAVILWRRSLAGQRAKGKGQREGKG